MERFTFGFSSDIISISLGQELPEIVMPRGNFTSKHRTEGVSIMEEKIGVEEALQRNDIVFIDLRSPAEYARGSIPGAVNLPLFDDEERAVLGRIYHQEGGQKAYLEGLSAASSKLPSLVSEILNAAKNKKPVLYCWRGGKRSESLTQVLHLLEIPALQLEGGYKSFRRFIREQLENYQLTQGAVVLHGYTGAGKTEIINHLQERGYPAVDLEGLGQHRGSVFGAIGMGLQPTQQNFDALLAINLQKLSKWPYIIVEGEGNRLGRLTLPPSLLREIKGGCRILVKTPLEIRVARLVQEYTAKPDGSPLPPLREGILKLQKKLGPKTTESLLSKLEQKNFRAVARTLCLAYYDPLYKESHPGKNTFDAVINGSDTVKAAGEIEAFVANRFGREETLERSSTHEHQSNAP